MLANLASDMHASIEMPLHQEIIGLKNSSKVMIHPIKVEDMIVHMPKKKELVGIKNSSKVMIHPVKVSEL